MKALRESKHDILQRSLSCPNCGAPYPVMEKWDDRGNKYKSSLTLLRLRLFHSSFTYRSNQRPVLDKSIATVCLLAYGIMTFAHFGIGFFLLCKQVRRFGLYHSEQFKVTYSPMAHNSLCVQAGHGLIAKDVMELSIMN